MAGRVVPVKVRLAVLAVVVAYMFGATKLERRRIEAHAIAPSGTPGPALVNEARPVGDMQALSSAEFQGRLPGTDGSRRARQLILRRFRELGLEPVNGSYEQKFSFTHHSIKAEFVNGVLIKYSISSK